MSTTPSQKDAKAIAPRGKQRKRFLEKNTAPRDDAYSTFAIGRSNIGSFHSGDTGKDIHYESGKAPQTPGTTEKYTALKIKSSMPLYFPGRFATETRPKTFLQFQSETSEIYNHSYAFDMWLTNVQKETKAALKAKQINTKKERVKSRKERLKPKPAAATDTGQPTPEGLDRQIRKMVSFA
ncbi:hypothetical protein CVT25_000996 [Psilocybe cyanescens]|uniref:Uncharacterized protein n=1 Tax=Psilocybe cyanescens TaxID=93625 RepID=A0A409XMD9_PSICY|nr:hypothetical protein CVT25_000996 [Psilocybe cyanescens]